MRNGLVSGLQIFLLFLKRISKNSVFLAYLKIRVVSTVLAISLTMDRDVVIMVPCLN